MITEDQFEQQALQWFQVTGWKGLAGATLATLRDALLLKLLSGQLTFASNA